MERQPSESPPLSGATPTITSISAVTLATHDMSRAVHFYRALGFALHAGGEDASFTSFHFGPSYLNLITQPRSRQWSWWGRVIFYVLDVDALYERAIAHGLNPEAAPRDAEWGERFFHLLDPDGIEYADIDVLKRKVLVAVRELISEDVKGGVIDLRFRIDAEDRDGMIVYTLDFADAVNIIPDDK